MSIESIESTESIKTIAFYGGFFNFNVKFSDLPDGSGVRVTIPNHECEVAWDSSFPTRFAKALRRFMSDEDVTKIQEMVLDRNFKGFTELWGSSEEEVAKARSKGKAKVDSSSEGRVPRPKAPS